MQFHDLVALIFLITASAAGFECQSSSGSIRASDELAWRTLGGISTPTQSTGAATTETPVSWRLWWNYQEVYPMHPGPQPPEPTNTAGQFRKLPCQAESERDPSHQPQDPCEVIWLNDASVGYVFANKFWMRENVIKEAAASQIRFPMSPRPIAIEMKTEWQSVDRRDPNRYVTGVDLNGKTRVLVAFHMMMRAQPNWVWATFIHEDFARQVSEAGATLNDSFGNDHGRPSKRLSELLKCDHVEVLSHYKLIGTQTDFATLLGNPLIELPEAIQQKKISCMSCHSHAVINQIGQMLSFPVQSGQPTLPPGADSTNFNFTLSEHASCEVVLAKKCVNH